MPYEMFTSRYFTSTFGPMDGQPCLWFYRCTVLSYTNSRFSDLHNFRHLMRDFVNSSMYEPYVVISLY